MATSFRTYKFGKNKSGQPIRSMNDGPWHIMPNVTVAQVKKATEEVWTYNGQFQGKTLKEFCQIDAEMLDMFVTLLHADAPHMPAARILLLRK